MYYYAPDDNRKGRTAGIAAAVCYLAIFVALNFLVSFRTEELHPPSEGILVDFGTESDGTGEDNVSLSQSEELASSQAASGTEEYLTQEVEEAPALSATSNPQDRLHNASDNANNTEAKNNATATAEVREVNRRALFPGRSAGSDAASQGSGADSQGNRGSEAGGDGSNAGTGTGTQGVSFDLQGRRPIGSLPSPAYESNDAEGIVIVEITVDTQGRVQSASFMPHGSTTQDAGLLEAALRAARKARFTPNESNALQTGSITYVFRLK